jgi:nucleotide-binding universal stress UspA family protein
MDRPKTALRLLVAVDGSGHAQGALRFVAALAARGARLDAVLLSVRRPVMVGEVGVIAPASIAAESQRRAAADALEAAGRELSALGVAHALLEEVNDPAAAILECAKRENCDALVVGSRGRGALQRALLGSVSSAVVRASDRPVIVTGAARLERPEGPLRILAAVDGSESALRALGFAAALARALPGSALHLLHVQAQAGPLAQEAAEVALAEARALAGREGVPHTAEVSRDDAPAEAIARAAAEGAAGLVAMGTHGRGPVAELLLGSVAQGVLQRVAVPVLLAR